jgi:hypothetical protein
VSPAAAAPTRESQSSSGAAGHSAATRRSALRARSGVGPAAATQIPMARRAGSSVMATAHAARAIALRAPTLA